MSTLSQFSGGGIKSIQRGAIASFFPTSTATITAVNTAKTMLNFCGCSDGYAVISAGVEGFAGSRIALTSSTQVTAAAPFNVGNNIDGAYDPDYFAVISYEVIEYF